MCDGNGVVGAQLGHPGAHLRGSAAQVRQQHHVGQIGEARGELRLMFVDVEAGTGEASAREARATSALSSMIGPRAVFTRIAVGFIAASMAASIRCEWWRGKRHVHRQKVAGFDKFGPARPGATGYGSAASSASSTSPPGGWMRAEDDLHTEGRRP